MNKYERHQAERATTERAPRKLVWVPGEQAPNDPRFLLPTDRVYVADDPSTLITILGAAGFRWSSTFYPTLEQLRGEAVRVDVNGICRHAPLEYYEHQYPHVPVVHL
jgi:hypothetical protein